MTGGYFEYNQFLFEDIASDLKEVVALNTDNYTEDVIIIFQEVIDELLSMSDKVHTIDLLLSKNIEEEEFTDTWEEKFE